MGFNTSRADQEKLANEALIAKLQMEAILSPRLTEIFNVIENDYRALFSVTGSVIDAHLYDDEISAALKGTYVQGAELAGDRILSFIVANPDDSLSQAIALLSQANDVSTDVQIQSIRDRKQVSLREFINTSVATSTRQIGDTTNGQLNRFANNAEMEAAQEGQFLSNTEIAGIAAVGFGAAIAGRVKTIAMTESQNAFEGAAEIERVTVLEELTTLQIRGEGVARAVNRWVTRGDEKVRTPRRGARFNHVEADGQERQEGVPFVVSGELLLRPGDSSLGASIGNTINCRCTLVPIIDVDF